MQFESVHHLLSIPPSLPAIFPYGLHMLRPTNQRIFYFSKTKLMCGKKLFSSIIINYLKIRQIINNYWVSSLSSLSVVIADLSF